MTTQTAFLLNGAPVATGVRPDTTLLDLLRGPLALKGTKEGCAEGDCGACTVLFKRPGVAGPPLAANACIMTVAQIEGAEITTVEGLAPDGVLNAVQDEMARNGSSQCGFCTPGIAVALSGLLARDPDPDEAAIHDALAGNLCRCTGYRPIVDATRAAAARLRAELGGDEAPQPEARHAMITSHTDAGGATVHRPHDLRGLLKLRREHPDAVLLAGGTDLAVPLAGYETRWPRVIATGHVGQLRRIEATDTHWTFGAAVTWQEALEAVRDDYPSLATLIRRFGSIQIRSMGTIGGNIGTASPIGDGPPALIALGTTIGLASLEGGARDMPLEDFFVDYRRTALRDDEVITHVTVPRARAGTRFRTYKVSKRYDQDISTVCGAYRLDMDGGAVADIAIAYGGMAATPKRAPHAEAALRGRPLTLDAAREAGRALGSDFSPLTDWRGSAAYRHKVAANLIERLARDLAGETVEVMAP
ncbi:MULTISPECIES: xanthine dehydrogenase small subunit [unclassified Roseitalea]|uniref:xanthine dehydrogenase small subunit n=1 Tax=unclassified Roseitalea TaxID=2639107 RepID=UPI00273E71BB|nr:MULTISPECIES: xanthine dehydrogenase small subunit [unclassified Roseitalea]